MNGVALEILPCSICDAPGVCRHREPELLDHFATMDRFPPRRRRAAEPKPQKRRSSVNRIDDEGKPPHWASFVIAHDHSREQAAEGQAWDCCCRSCVAVRPHVKPTAKSPEAKA